jgi:PAS domain S-box-containing protein
MEYGEQIGIDEIGIYDLEGREAFSARGSAEASDLPGRRRIVPEERASFLTAVSSMNSSGFFNSRAESYSRYVPVRATGPCMECHTREGENLGVLHIKLSTANDFELLSYTRKLIWILGLIALMPVGALLVSNAIIRDKNRLYARLKDSNASLTDTLEELDETRSNLQLIFDNSRVIIITTDNEGRVLEFNREAEMLLEYSKAEMVGRDVLILYDNPIERTGPMKNGSEGGAVIWEARNREVTMTSKSGRTFHVIMSLATMVDNDGEIIGTVGVGKDISEQKALQFKLLQSEKLAGIGTLASGIAHEINNPLAAIMGMAEAALDEDDMELVRAYTRDIIQYTSSANKIVKSLSAYSRSANSEEKYAVDISAVIHSSLKMARHTAARMDIRIVTEIEECCMVSANLVEIQQIFVNLIVNAIQAMDQKGVLKLSCRQSGTFVVASVADTGPGIPAEDLNQIYDPFFTTKPVGKGTGLGLYVVYRLVTKHGGTIDLETGEGRGTTFTVRFPEEESDEDTLAI